MIYITGDTHGEIEKIKDAKVLKKNDTLIICGDFGFIWNGDEKEHKILKQLGSYQFYVLFLDGEHENFDLLERYEQKIFNWGRVHHIFGNLFHLMRGEIYIIEGKTFFTFGGGDSKYKEFHINSGKWWKQEMPSKEEMEYGFENLNKVGKKVDYILTHEPPAHIKALLTKDYQDINVLNTFFDSLSENIQYKKWFFGSLHLDKEITKNQIAVFNNLIPIEKKAEKKAFKKERLSSV